MLRRFTLAMLAMVLAAPAPAAAFDLGWQDDETLKYQPDVALARADATGAGTVRIMVPANRWAEIDTYVAAAARAKATGHRVIASLMSWRQYPTPAGWAFYATGAVTKLAPYVDGWSVMNEPNMDDMRPATRGRSGMIARGRAYRRVWDRTAPVIRRLDPSAKLIVGDLMPVAGRRFMRAFYRAGRPRIRPDALGIHPYMGYSTGLRDRSRDGDWRHDGVEDAARFARRHRLALWVTEWALSPKQPAGDWAYLLRRFARAGARVVVVYDTDSRGQSGGWWNTEMSPAALSAVTKAARSL